MSTPSLLPPNATTLERRIAASGFVTPSGYVPTLWNADTCPAALLPWLAWAESVDDWNPAWSEERQRAVIKTSRAIHRLKGTVAAIKQALVARGQPDAEVVERNGQWAIYKVILKHPITVSQAKELKGSVVAVARNCCHLAGFDYVQASLLHNNFAKRDGNYTRGFVNIQE
jgi:phage tail P2-like protein